MLDDIPLDDLKFQNVEDFFNEKESERQRFEYKRELYRLKEDDQKRELVIDVCSFANTDDGGYLFLGINAVNGVPSALIGVDCQNADDEESRMRQIIRRWSDPPLDQKTFKIIPLQRPNDGKYVFVVRIEPSANAPHACYFDSVREFYIRHGNGKEPMTTTELRDAFVASETAIQRMESFREERIKYIHNDENGRIPVSIGQGGAKCILHLFPSGCFRRKPPLDAKEMKTREGYFRPLSAEGGATQFRFNVDGLFSFRSDQRFLPPSRIRSDAYTQVYHDGGIVEGVNASEVVHVQRKQLIDSEQGWSRSQKNELLTNYIETMLIHGIRGYVQGLKSLPEIRPPFWAFVSLIGVTGADISMNRRIDRELILLPGFQITTLDADPAPLLKPACDAIWRAAGYEDSKSFREILAQLPFRQN